MSLLDEPGYRHFLAETHPALGIEDARLGGVPSFLATLDVGEPVMPGRLRRLMDWSRGFVPELVSPRALFLGTPFERYDQSHVLDDIPTVPELTERVVRAARRHGADVAVLTNVRPERLDPEWTERGWVTLPSFPDTVVDLDAPTFDAHLKTLPQGDRSGVRRNIKRFQRAGHRLERVYDAAQVGPALYRCYRPFFERATVRWQPHTPAYFAGLTSLGPAVELTVARTERGDLIGFVVAFEDMHGVQAGRIGVHPDYYRRDAVYFRLLYHPLEAALARGSAPGQRLSLEPTGYRMKRHLGARKVPLVNLILGVSDTWCILLRQFEHLGRFMLRHLEDRATLERLY